MHPAAQTIMSKLSELHLLRESIDGIDLGAAQDPETEVYAPPIGNKNGLATLEVLVSYFTSEYIQLLAVSDAWEYAFSTPNPLSTGSRSTRMEKVRSSFSRLHSRQDWAAPMVARYCERELERLMITSQDSQQFTGEDQLDHLLSFVFGQAEARGLLNFLDRDRSPIGPQAATPQEELDLERPILRELMEMSWQDRRKAIHYLKAYSHSCLRQYHAFCDSRYTVAYDFSLTSILTSELEGETHMNSGNIFDNTEDPFLEPIDGSNLSGDHLPEIIGSLIESLKGRDLDSFIDDLLEGGLIPDQIYPSGASMNVIPSRRNGTCAPVLAAFSSGGGTSKRGIWRILKKVRTHLIECHPVTKRVIFFCDTWDPRKFGDEFLDDLGIFHARWGVEFVFIMSVGSRCTRLPVVF